MRGYKKTLLVMLSMASILFSNVPIGENVNAASKKEMKIEWFDVGAGDSMFIKLPNKKTVLIDAGTKSDGYAVVQKLRQNKVRTIDYCITTHPDMDHCGGMTEIFSYLNVKNFYYPDDTKFDTHVAEKVMSLAKAEKGCNLYSPERGTIIKGGNGARLKFVQDDSDYSSDNQDSLAVLIEYGKLKVLTCGDNEKGSEEMIEQSNVDVLQLPHHGSKYASSRAFIEKFDPEYIVVSTDGKKYGHPNQEVFDICKEYDKNIQVYRTDKIGDIKIVATQKSWKFRKKGIKVSSITADYSDNSKNSNKSNVKTTENKKATSASKNKTVYTTKTGKKYHSTRNCRGLSNANEIFEVKESEVGSLEKCSICW